MYSFFFSSTNFGSFLCSFANWDSVGSRCPNATNRNFCHFSKQFLWNFASSNLRFRIWMFVCILILIFLSHILCINLIVVTCFSFYLIVLREFQSFRWNFKLFLFRYTCFSICLTSSEWGQHLSIRSPPIG